PLEVVQPERVTFIKIDTARHGPPDPRRGEVLPEDGVHQGRFPHPGRAEDREVDGFQARRVPALGELCHLAALRIRTCHGIALPRPPGAGYASLSPRMKASTIARAVSSSCCFGGDFMK